MSAVTLTWSSLLNLTELDFEPEAPKVLKVSDELVQAISWLTGATAHDRKLLRCDENGVLLVDNGWSNLAEVETDELHPTDGVPDTYIATVSNKGVLIATGAELVKVTFTRVFGGDTENIYIPRYTLYWYPHLTYSVVVTCVPEAGGSASYVGLTAFN